MLSKLTLLFLFVAIDQISGHGMMLDPPNRSSLWRTNPAANANYNDNQNFCGGFSEQWYTFNGKCGVCGDKYDDAHPQANENTGLYGQGIVVREYSAGNTIDVQILFSSNHKGSFTIDLCKLDNPNAPESGEDCFESLPFADGTKRFNLTGTETTVNTKVVLPAGVTGDRFVLRWNYTCGNNWGFCEDGTGAIGCGPQETFRSCADIAIR